MIKLEPQVTYCARMVKRNNIIDRSHKLLDVGITVGAIRATVNRSTVFIPKRMMLGREVMMPLDLIIVSNGEEVGIGVLLGMAGWRHI